MLNDWTILKPGMRVKLIANWNLGKGYQNRSGEMDSFLGQIVTIEELTDDCRWFTVEEDGGVTHCTNRMNGRIVPKWMFDRSMVAEVVDYGDSTEETDTGAFLASLLDIL